MAVLQPYEEIEGVRFAKSGEPFQTAPIINPYGTPVRALKFAAWFVLAACLAVLGYGEWGVHFMDIPIAAIGPLLGYWGFRKTLRLDKAFRKPYTCRISDGVHPSMRLEGIGTASFEGSWLVFESETFSFRVQPRDFRRPPCQRFRWGRNAEFNLPETFPKLGIYLKVEGDPYLQKRFLTRLAKWQNLPSADEPATFPPLPPAPEPVHLHRSVISAWWTGLILSIGTVVCLILIAPFITQHGRIHGLVPALSAAALLVFGIYPAAAIFERHRYLCRQSLTWGKGHIPSIRVAEHRRPENSRAIPQYGPNDSRR